MDNSIYYDLYEIDFIPKFTGIRPSFPYSLIIINF